MAAPTQKSERQTIKKTVPARVDKKMGLGVIHSKDSVYVSSVVPGSLAAEHFQVNDKIVSINGVLVKDKRQCKELILTASTESDFDVIIERLVTQSPPVIIPELSFQEPDQIPDLSFTPDKSSKKKPKKRRHQKEQKVKSKELVNPCDYDSYLIGEEDFASGNPLDGLILPGPKDIREIVRKKLPGILEDFMKTEDTTEDEDDSDSDNSASGSSTTKSVSKKSAKSKKKEKTTPSPASKLTFNKAVQLQTIATDVPSEKQLMRPKKR